MKCEEKENPGFTGLFQNTADELVRSWSGCVLFAVDWDYLGVMRYLRENRVIDGAGVKLGYG